MEEKKCICDFCGAEYDEKDGVKIIAILGTASLIGEDNYNPVLNYNLCFDCFKDKFETPNEE